MSEYRVGELVDITIRGARVTNTWSTDGDPWVEVEFGDGHALNADLSAVTVTRVAPPEWPPRPGDLWRDRTRAPWFAVDITDYDEAGEVTVELQGESTYNYGRMTPDRVMAEYGPLTLVHREPEAGESGE